MNPCLSPVVVDQRAQVGQADDLNLAVTDLDQHRRVLRLGGTGDRQQRLLVIDIERAYREVLLAGTLHQFSGTLDACGH